jgi:hypothetical protein
MKELQTYICHKRVQAFKIAEIHPFALGAELVCAEADITIVSVNNAFIIRHAPEVGGYYVRYEDGYESYSPAKAFEEGYTIQGDNIYEKGWRAGWDGANKEVIKVLDKLKAIRERHHG